MYRGTERDGGTGIREHNHGGSGEVCRASCRSKDFALRQIMSLCGPIWWRRRVGRCPHGCTTEALAVKCLSPKYTASAPASIAVVSCGQYPVGFIRSGFFQMRFLVLYP